LTTHVEISPTRRNREDSTRNLLILLALIASLEPVGARAQTNPLWREEKVCHR